MRKRWQIRHIFGFKIIIISLLILSCETSEILLNNIQDKAYIISPDLWYEAEITGYPAFLSCLLPVNNGTYYLFTEQRSEYPLLSLYTASVKVSILVPGTFDILLDLSSPEYPLPLDFSVPEGLEKILLVFSLDSIKDDKGTFRFKVTDNQVYAGISR